MSDLDPPPLSPPLTALTFAPSSRSKTLACSSCARKFSRAEHLARHMRCHTKEKPFQCVECGKRYSRLDVMTRHCRNAHTTYKPATNSCDPPRPSISETTTDVHSGHPHQDSSLAHTEPLRTADYEWYNNSLAEDPELAVLMPEGLSQSQPNNVQNHMPSYKPHAAQNPGYMTLENPQINWNTHVDLCVPQLVDQSELYPLWDVNEEVYTNAFEPSPLAHGYMMHELHSSSPNKDQLQAERVQAVWFTRNRALPAPPIETTDQNTSGMPSPQPSSVEVDDHHRTRLRKRLQIRSFEPRLPSTKFLNTCIRLYFSKAHPLFPVIHPATFQPSKANTALTLAICVVGTLFMGLDQAVDVGMHLFERLQKATLLYWEKAKAENPDDIISIIQSTILGQTFSLMSGNSNLLLTADAFQGPPIAWARQQGLFDVQRPVILEVDLLDHNLEQTWHSWARKEEHIRTTHALGILDAELATLLHHQPILRLNCRRLSLTSSERLFMATNARDWKASFLVETQGWSGHRPECLSANSVSCLDISQIPASSIFSAYAVLEELNMRILAIKAEDHNNALMMQDVDRQLSAFFRHFLDSARLAESGSQCLSVLWHSVHISMLVDMNTLEKVVGREGSKITADERLRITNWADSDNASRAVIHALLIKRGVESMKLVDEPAIHVPRSLLSASITLFCYGKFSSQQQRDKLAISDGYLPNLGVAGKTATSLLSEACDPTSGPLLFQKTLHAMIQLLKRIGSWGLSRRFAAVLNEITAEEYYHN